MVERVFWRNLGSPMNMRVSDIVRSVMLLSRLQIRRREKRIMYITSENRHYCNQIQQMRRESMKDKIALVYAANEKYYLNCKSNIMAESVIIW